MVCSGLVALVVPAQLCNSQQDFHGHIVSHGSSVVAEYLVLIELQSIVTGIVCHCLTASIKKKQTLQLYRNITII